MALLELVRQDPDWTTALSKALERPAGVPERRQPREDDPVPGETGHRRLSDDLVWLRQAIDEPQHHGLAPVEDTSAVALWEALSTDFERLCRLRDRGVLEAAGFLLHEPSGLDDAA